MDPIPRWVIAIPTLCFLLLILAIISYLFYQIVKSHRKSDENQYIYRTAVTFMTFNWLSAVNYAGISAYNICIFLATGFVVKPFAVNGKWQMVFGFLLVFHNYLLLLALFTRLQGLFKETPVPLSKGVTSVFTSGLILLPMMCLLLPFALTFGLGDVA